MSEENTITIKKDSLWKYATFLLLAVVIVGVVLLVKGNTSGNGNAVNTGGDTTGPVDLSIFLNNPDLYPSLGPENADNVVIEFADFQCPYCALASGLPDWASGYQSQYGDLIGSAGYAEDQARKGNLRFVYVTMSFLGQESVYAAEAAYCANEQGKFWEMHDGIFAASDGPSENDGKYSKENLKKIAQGIDGLDQSQFADCLDNDKYGTAVQTAGAQASTAASGTPTVYVNGVKTSPTTAAIQAALQ